MVYFFLIDASGKHYSLIKISLTRACEGGGSALGYTTNNIVNLFEQVDTMGPVMPSSSGTTRPHLKLPLPPKQ